MSNPDTRLPLEQALKNLLADYPLASLSNKRLSLGNQNGASHALYGSVELTREYYKDDEEHKEVLEMLEDMKKEGPVRYCYTIEFDELPDKNMLLAGLDEQADEKS